MNRREYSRGPRANWVRSALVIAYALIATASLAADANAKKSAATVITGEVTITETVTLKPDASLQVRLVDVLSDAPAVVVAHRLIKPVTALPVRFELPFNAKQIDATHTYVVDARLVSGYREWHTVAPHPVLTNGASSTVTIVAE